MALTLNQSLLSSPQQVKFNNVANLGQDKFHNVLDKNLNSHNYNAGCSLSRLIKKIFNFFRLTDVALGLEGFVNNNTALFESKSRTELNAFKQGVMLLDAKYQGKYKVASGLRNFQNVIAAVDAITSKEVVPRTRRHGTRKNRANRFVPNAATSAVGVGAGSRSGSDTESGSSATLASQRSRTPSPTPKDRAAIKARIAAKATGTQRAARNVVFTGSSQHVQVVQVVEGIESHVERLVRHGTKESNMTSHDLFFAHPVHATTTKKVVTRVVRSERGLLDDAIARLNRTGSTAAR